VVPSELIRRYTRVVARPPVGPNCESRIVRFQRSYCRLLRARKHWFSWVIYTALSYGRVFTFRISRSVGTWQMRYEQSVGAGDKHVWRQYGAPQGRLEQAPSARDSLLVRIPSSTMALVLSAASAPREDGRFWESVNATPRLVPAGRPPGGEIE